MHRFLAILVLASVLAPRSSAAAALAELPFDITENHTFIEVIVNGERLSFVFDTGASATAINESTAERPLFLVRADDGSVRIARVFADSPAQKVGLMEGETIRLIDGSPADAMTLPEIRERLMAAGETVWIEVDRDGVSRVVMLRLRSNKRR